MAKGKFPKVVYVVSDDVYGEGRLVAVPKKDELAGLMVEDTEKVAIYTRTTVVKALVGENGKVTLKGGK